MTAPNTKEQDILIKAERVVRLGDEMTRILEDETTMLAARADNTYGQFVKKKQQMLVDYQGAVKSLLTKREDLDALSATTRAQLKATGSKLDAVARRNAEKLSVTAAATHKV